MVHPNSNMITIRKSEDRGHFDLGWLDTYHTFSFDQYYDPNHMGFRTLRVINEDRVQPGRGFPTHSHRDMEIVTFILEGALQHQDSMGNGSIIRPGDVQRMTAGTGVAHSESNPSQTDAVHLLQIWILPNERGLKPDYEQKAFSQEDKRAILRLIASADARDGSVRIHQDVNVYASLLEIGQEVVHQLAPNRHAWIQVARGAIAVNGEKLNESDGAAISGASNLTIVGRKSAEALLFDLA
jgi:redox-sensitive bicupin YhaK (pirin superfamily)